jgi:3'-phosphoadenosine 5'-phosphosulfate sulfotransferase (PAPS reductase)/FAD synthetase
MNNESKHVVAVSGGKDSCALALRLRELHPEIDYEFVITPTGDELPEMIAHWRKLEALLGRPLKVLPAPTLEQCISIEGMLPNFRARFCTRVIKIEPFLDYMATLPHGSVMYVGLRADEDAREGLLPPSDRYGVSMPMREWGWGIADVYEYLDCKGVDIPERTDCGVCFYQRLNEWKDLLDNHPRRYARYARIEKAAGYTFRSPGRDTWPADLYSLKREFKAGRKLRNVTKRDKQAMCPFCSK